MKTNWLSVFLYPKKTSVYDHLLNRCTMTKDRFYHRIKVLWGFPALIKMIPWEE